ncbi:MAG: ribulose-phosphate 3-epimerase [Spirochaetota bacterium]|nr:MAG: ribulose-phosphate 3-epimerase [Spirochaetota bacterium]
MKKTLKISLSMMCTSYLDLREDLDLFIKHKIDYLHIDIMDGHYVPNFSIGIDFCKAVYTYSRIPLDIHLMIEEPDRYIEIFSRFENSIISIHPETCYQPLGTIQEIKECKVKAGIAISPSISFESVKHLIPHLDMVNVMTVHPGYAGQRLFKPALMKLRKVSGYIEENDFGTEVEVDGNVSWRNLPGMIEAGADVFVAGTSSIFERDGSLEQNVTRFRKILDKAGNFNLNEN